MITVNTTDDKEVMFDNSLARKYSNIIAALPADVSTVKLNINSKYMNLVKLYIEHHGAHEAECPVPPLKISWEIKSVFKDPWDSEFFQNVLNLEKDEKLVHFLSAVEYLDMDIMLRKATLVVALNLVHQVGMDPDKLIEKFKN